MANILHIGDDIEFAQKHGIHTFKIFSGEELFDVLGELGLGKQIVDLADRLKIGIFVARLFNSPFQFENEENKIIVSCVEDIDYLILWQREQAKCNVACIMKVQSGILNYVKKFVSICPKSEKKINKKLNEKLLMLIHKIASSLQKNLLAKTFIKCYHFLKTYILKFKA